MKRLNVALDCDGVLANFSDGLIKRANKMGLGEHFPKTWKGVSYWYVSEHFSKVMKDAWLDPDFWLNLKPLPGAKALNFTPACYITSRPIKTEVTEKWLEMHGFPKAEVITVSKPEEKLQHMQDRGIDLLIDDYYVTIIQLLDNDLKAVLYKAPYQRGHEECKTLPTIECLSEVYKYV